MLAEGRVPPHDVVVTNPPYSQPHPQRLLAFLASNAKPWLALMPNWVYAKVGDHSPGGWWMLQSVCDTSNGG
jgi:hypothetical protein